MQQQGGVCAQVSKTIGCLLPPRVGITFVCVFVCECMRLSLSVSISLPVPLSLSLFLSFCLPLCMFILKQHSCEVYPPLCSDRRSSVVPQQSELQGFLNPH